MSDVIEVGGSAVGIREGVNRLAKFAKITAAGQGAVVLAGRCASTRTSETFTCEFVYELPCAWDDIASVQLITMGAAPATGAISGVFADVKAIGSLSDLDGAWTGTTAVTWLTQTAVRLVGGATLARRAYQLSDAAAITPVARTDGGTRALIACRALYGIGSYNFLGNNGASDIYTSWSSRSAGLARIRRNTTAGDQRTATSNWATEQFSPVVGFAYSTIKPHILIAGFGDSIAEGRGTYIGASQNHIACESLNAGQNKVLFSHMNLAWSGQTMTNILQNMEDAFRNGIVPDIAIIPCGSPNDVGNRSITTADIISTRRLFISMLETCARYGVTPLVWTWIPTNSAVNNYGSSDSLRVAYNADILAECQNAGIVCIDTATAISGVTTSGQVQMLAGTTSDNIHPNDTGITLLAGLIQQGLTSITGVVL